MTLTLQDIGIGASANDGTGDTPRAAGTKINANNAAIIAFLKALANLDTVGTAQIDNGAVTLAKMADMPTGRILGNNAVGAGPPLALTASQVKTLLAISAGDVSGLGGAATVNVGTSGAVIPLLSGANTWGAAQTLGANALVFNGSSLIADAANVLALRNGTNSQLYRIYGTFTDASNGRWLEIGTFNGADFVLQTNGNGTGAAAGALYLATAGNARWLVNTSGHLLANADATYDIGASGATRPRRAYLSDFMSTAGKTVASLTAAATAGAGARAFVTDATATTFGSTVSGGGSNKVPVYSDGTNWLIG